MAKILRERLKDSEKHQVAARVLRVSAYLRTYETHALKQAVGRAWKTLRSIKLKRECCISSQSCTKGPRAKMENDDGPSHECAGRSPRTVTQSEGQPGS